MNKYVIIGMLAIAMSAGWASAGVADATHVAATVANTAAENGTADWYTDNVDDPVKWRLRTGISGDWGNDPFTAGDSSNAYGDHLLLETTLTLDPGTTYDIYVDYTSNDSTTFNNWVIQGGLSPDSLIGYDRDGLEINGTQYTAGYRLGLSSMTTNRVLLRGYLGQATADATTGEVKVYVDDRAGGVDTTFNRTWYAGVAYEAVPEPATLALFSIGGLALLRKRK